LVLRGFPIEQGGFVLMLTGLARWEAAPAPPSADADEPTPEAVGPAPIEW
jgi:hypothetical protein